MKKFLVLPLLLTTTSAVLAAPAHVATATLNYKQASNVTKSTDGQEVKAVKGFGLSYLQLLNSKWGVKVDFDRDTGKGGIYSGAENADKQYLKNQSFGLGVVYKPYRTAYTFATLNRNGYTHEIDQRATNKGGEKVKIKTHGITLSVGASEFFKAGNQHGLTYALDYKIKTDKSQNDVKSNSANLLGNEKDKLKKLGLKVGYAYRF